MVSEVYFRESGCLKNRETARLAWIRSLTLVMFIVLGFHALLFIVALILAMSMTRGLPEQDFVKLVLSFAGLTVFSGIVYALFDNRFKEKSMVEVHGDGLLMGERFVRWSDIDDIKIWSENYVSAESGGAPIVGYGMYGYAYGYATSRQVNYRKYRYVIVQVFHKTGIDELYIYYSEFWKFVKAVLQAAKVSHLSDKSWLHKLEKMDKAS